MLKHFNKKQIFIIAVVAGFALIALIVIFATPEKPAVSPATKVPGTSSISDSPAIVVDDDGQISDTTGGQVNPMEPYFVGFGTLNGNPWGLTGTQVTLITKTLGDAIVTANQAIPSAQWTTKVSLVANSVNRTIADNGDIVTGFTIQYNDADRHSVQFVIPLDYKYRITLDRTALTP